MTSPSLPHSFFVGRWHDAHNAAIGEGAVEAAGAAIAAVADAAAAAGNVDDEVRATMAIEWYICSVPRLFIMFNVVAFAFTFPFGSCAR